MNSVLRRRDFNRLAVGLFALGLSSHAVGTAKSANILVVGDSLSAEYDTTAGGLARLSTLLRQHQPKVVVIELGGNDALRGFPLKTTENNLIQMVTACYKAKAAVLLIGMQVPPNYGQEYAQEFSRMFVRISQQQRTQLVPFLLKGVADAADPTALFQPDRIHPKAQAHPIILSNVWPVLKRML